jgi:hypothetical protein
MNLEIDRTEALAIHEALFHEAAELRRKARRRDAAGPKLARYREACRASAQRNEDLARRIGREFGFTTLVPEGERDGKGQAR